MTRSRQPRKNQEKPPTRDLPSRASDEALLAGNKAKFEVFGEEMIEKEVKQSGNSGRVYLPPDWIGKHVKIIRID
jgi:putative transposon-encoded protein